MRLDEILGLNFREFANQQKIALFELLSLVSKSLRSSELGRKARLINAAGLNAGIAGRTRRRTVGSHSRRSDRTGGWLADTDKPLGHYRSLWICRACGDFIWRLSSPSGSAARSDNGLRASELVDLRSLAMA